MHPTCPMHVRMVKHAWPIVGGHVETDAPAMRETSPVLNERMTSDRIVSAFLTFIMADDSSRS